MRIVPPAYTPVPPAALAALAGSTAGAHEALRGYLAQGQDVEHVHLLGSGTQSLQWALELLAGREGVVALPGWGCFDLASAAVGAGVRVRLYDLDPATLQPERASLECLLDGVDLVVLVSFFGIPVDADIAGLVIGSGVALVHDAAQAHGAIFEAGSVEGVADATVLSFGRGKGWTGLGGGALVLRTDRSRSALAAWLEAGGTAPGGGASARAPMLVRGLAQALLGRPALYGIPARIPALGLGQTRYHPPGPLEALSDASAAVLLASRPAAEAEAGVRRERAEWLMRRIGAGARVDPIQVDSSIRAGYLRLPALSAIEVDREGRALGVLPSYPIPLGQLTPLKGLLQAADPLPGSARLATTLVTLPTHSRMSARDRARLDVWLS